MLLDNPDHRDQHDQHARAVLIQGHGQVERGKAQVDGIAAQPEYACGKQLTGGAMGNQGRACQAQLDRCSQHQGGANHGQRQNHPVITRECRGGERQGLIDAITHQQPPQIQGRWRHHNLRVLEGHGNHLVTENEEEKYAAILNTMTASCLSAGKLCEVFY